MHCGSRLLYNFSLQTSPGLILTPLHQISFHSTKTPALASPGKRKQGTDVAGFKTCFNKPFGGNDQISSGEPLNAPFQNMNKKISNRWPPVRTASPQRQHAVCTKPRPRTAWQGVEAAPSSAASLCGAGPVERSLLTTETPQSCLNHHRLSRRFCSGCTARPAPLRDPPGGEASGEPIA